MLDFLLEVIICASSKSFMALNSICESVKSSLTLHIQRIGQKELMESNLTSLRDNLKIVVMFLHNAEELWVMCDGYVLCLPYRFTEWCVGKLDQAAANVLQN